MIRDDIRIIWLCSESAIKGNASSRVTKIARIFGTNTSVCSWIWVSAWNSDTTTPTTRPTIISGDDTTTMVQIASRATSRVSAPVIFVSLALTCFRHSGIRLLAQARNPYSRSWLWIPGSLAEPVIGPASGRTRWLAPRNDNSDRHLHDVFVGLDDAIAHRHQRRDRDVGLRHRRHHVHHIGLARRHRDSLRIGFFSRLQHASDRVLEHRSERRPARFGTFAGAAGVQDAGKVGVGICSDGG